MLSAITIVVVGAHAAAARTVYAALFDVPIKSGEHVRAAKRYKASRIYLLLPEQFPDKSNAQGGGAPQFQLHPVEGMFPELRAIPTDMKFQVRLLDSESADSEGSSERQYAAIPKATDSQNLIIAIVNEKWERGRTLALLPADSGRLGETVFRIHPTAYSSIDTAFTLFTTDQNETRNTLDTFLVNCIYGWTSSTPCILDELPVRFTAADGGLGSWYQGKDVGRDKLNLFLPRTF